MTQTPLEEDDDGSSAGYAKVNARADPQLIVLPGSVNEDQAHGRGEIHVSSRSMGARSVTESARTTGPIHGDPGQGSPESNNDTAAHSGGKSEDFIVPESKIKAVHEAEASTPGELNESDKGRAPGKQQGSSSPSEVHQREWYIWPTDDQITAFVCGTQAQDLENKMQKTPDSAAHFAGSLLFNNSRHGHGAFLPLARYLIVPLQQPAPSDTATSLVIKNL